MGKKVLLVDMSNYEYFQAFSLECSKQIDTTIITRFPFRGENKIPYFYRYSGKMPSGIARSIIRAIEYLIGMHKTYQFIKKNYFDVVHFHWAVIPTLDTYYYKKIKKHCGMLVYTAHDLVPHVGLNKKRNMLSQLYSVPDKIVVHGHYMYNEAKNYFPEIAHKIYIQQFGVSLGEILPVSKETFNKHKRFLHDSYNKKVISFIGQIYYYKGLDFLLDYIENNRNTDVYFLIVGSIVEKYDGLMEQIERIKNRNNVYVFLNRFSDEEENLFYSNSDLIVTSYRSASMSGVLFSAAKYKKTVLSTTVGCMQEYLAGVNCVFKCEPNKSSFTYSLNNIIDEYSKKDLQKYGIEFHDYIIQNYSWEKIISNLLKDCYCIK